MHVRCAGQGSARPPVIWSSIYDIIGNPDRLGGRQYDAEPADPDALGLHRKVKVPQNPVSRRSRTPSI
jgi:hypothetical protein